MLSTFISTIFFSINLQSTRNINPSNDRLKPVMDTALINMHNERSIANLAYLFFWKSSKIASCCLLQIISGSLWVKIGYSGLTVNWSVCPISNEFSLFDWSNNGWLSPFIPQKTTTGSNSPSGPRLPPVNVSMFQWPSEK